VSHFLPINTSKKEASMPSGKETPVFTAKFGQLISCPECGSRDVKFSRIKETPKFFLNPCLGILRCYGHCSKLFQIDIDESLSDIIEETVRKLLLKNNTPSKDIEAFLSKIK